MLIHDSCQAAIQACLDTKTFAIARLFSEEKTMRIHIHDCYEIGRASCRERVSASV